MIIHRDTGSAYLNNTCFGKLSGLTRTPTLKAKEAVFDLGSEVFSKSIPSNGNFNPFLQTQGFEISTHEGSSFDTVLILKDCWIASFKNYRVDLSEGKAYVTDLEFVTSAGLISHEKSPI